MIITLAQKEAFIDRLISVDHNATIADYFRILDQSRVDQSAAVERAIQLVSRPLYEVEFTAPKGSPRIKHSRYAIAI